MTNTVSAITTSITSAALWGTVQEVIPIVLITVTFALGFYLVRRQVKKLSKGKAGL